MFTDVFKECAKCGKPLKRSLTDYTVNCPDCRGRTRKPTGKYSPVTCARCGHVHTTLKCDRCGF
jgi:DNA-directed RNA polymerase subunit RPC12/RpoP